MPPALHRDFNIDRPKMRTEGPSFALYDETFHCVPEAPGGAIDTLITGITYDANGNEIYHATNVNRFIEMVLLEERIVERPVERPDGAADGEGPAVMEEVADPTDDLQRWRILMQDKARPVQIGELVDIVVWLQEHYGVAPYRTVQALGAWTLHRRNYFRGRLRLVGLRWDDLSIGEQLDIAEAVIAEGTNVDANLDALADLIAEKFPSKETWGTQPAARRGMEAAERVFGGPTERRPKPTTVTPDEPPGDADAE